MKLTKTQQYVLIAAGALIALAAMTAVYFLAQDDPAVPGSQGEATSTTEASWTIEATDTATSEAETSAPEPPAELPSYKRYARVVSVGGMEGQSWYVDLLFIDIYTEAEAKSYASAHGLTVPDNGILFVEDETVSTVVPLRSDVSIVYKTGSVEALEMKTGTVKQLRAFAYGETEIFDGAVSDLWEVTVEQGIVTKLEMVAIAD